MWYRSIDYLEIEMGPLTVFFGKNNSGKTNILEAIYGVLAHDEIPGFYAGANLARAVRASDDKLTPLGALYAELEARQLFDDEVLSLNAPQEVSLVGESGTLELKPLPPEQVSFVGYFDKPGLYFADPQPYFAQIHSDAEYHCVDVELGNEFEERRVDGPRPRPVFLDWEFADIDEHITKGIKNLLQERPGSEPRWLEHVEAEDGGSWQVRPVVYQSVASLGALATSLLPDFLDGSIRAKFSVPSTWGAEPTVSVVYEERGTDRYARSLTDFGRGAARWIAAAIQIALHVLSNLENLQFSTAQQSFSGHVLFVDEPEAHLHPSAVASIVRWCEKMVDQGFNVIVASHHEEFLRVSGDHVKLVKVSRDLESPHTKARALLNSAAPLLQELAAEVGMHPATLLSLHKAALFVEGPLDEAVLDEYAGPALEAAGVVVIPIHGTKNLEGLVDGEFPGRLGLKMGVLTDATVAATIWERSNTKRSSEEKKLVRLVRRLQEQDRPAPTLFGVPEADLLFALPGAAVREHLGGQFPGWHELVEECRVAEDKGPSDSCDWKTYAETHYGLPLTATGVRELVHSLDVNGVELPSIKNVVEEILAWAKDS